MMPRDKIDLSEADERFRILFENSVDVIYIMNPKSQVSFVTPSVQEVLGYIPEKFKTLTMTQLVHPDDMESAKQTYQMLTMSPGAGFGPIEQRIKHRDGSWRWMEVTGTNLMDTPGIDGIVMTSRDVTERKQAGDIARTHTHDLERASLSQDDTRKAMLNLLEDFDIEQKALAEAKAKDEAILESTGEGLIAVDNDRKIMVINKVAVDMLGWKMKELIGKVITDLPLEDERGKLVPLSKQPAALALVSGTITKATYFLVRKDETRFPVAITATPIKLGDKTIGLIELIRDITKETEIDKAKTEFVSLASHQLRTPLSAVSWYAEMLLAGDAGAINPEQKRYLEEVYRGNRRMTDLVDALLNVSRLELGTFIDEPESIDILAMTESVISEQKIQIDDQKLKFLKFFENDIPNIYTDPKFLRMVIQNLLSNAVKYTPEEGTVTIGLSLAKKNTMIDNKKIMADSIAIVVSDTGYGIPKSQQVKVFTKLFRADNVRERNTEGTGLGLYIVKSIVDHVSGMVWFKSEEDKGTTFYVTLPILIIKTKE